MVVNMKLLLAAAAAALAGGVLGRNYYPLPSPEAQQQTTPNSARLLRIMPTTSTAPMLSSKGGTMGDFNVSLPIT
ncbi:hypothetical protein H4R19_006324 [Coemansia spiralis]|nr:hypothetical protein H4R19_006324 [Coemansia spiralis]